MELTYILNQNQNVSKIGVESNTICICDIQLQFLIHFTWLNCIKNRSWLLHTLTLTQSQNVSKIGAKLITICICIYVCVTFNSNFWYILFSNTCLYTELQESKLLQLQLQKMTKWIHSKYGLLYIIALACSQIIEYSLLFQQYYSTKNHFHGYIFILQSDSQNRIWKFCLPASPTCKCKLKSYCFL